MVIYVDSRELLEMLEVAKTEDRRICIVEEKSVWRNSVNMSRRLLMSKWMALCSDSQGLVSIGRCDDVPRGQDPQAMRDWGDRPKISSAYSKVTKSCMC